MCLFSFNLNFDCIKILMGGWSKGTSFITILPLFDVRQDVLSRYVIELRYWSWLDIKWSKHFAIEYGIFTSILF